MTEVQRRRRAPRGSGGELRTEILEAARELLARTGSADDVSIRAVSKMVGVTAPSIYRHFADKDALLDAVVADVFSHLDAEMRLAAAELAAPMEKLRQLGLAYVRFAREHPEQYRLATMQPAVTERVDQVLASAAFTHFAETVQDCIAAGIFRSGDAVTIALELWAAAHGIASLQITKPWLPWGDLDDVADRVLRAACVGHAVCDRIEGDVTPDAVLEWLSAHDRQGA